LSHVLAVSGSPNVASRSAVLLGQVSAIPEQHGHTIDTLTLRDLPAGALMHADSGDPAIIDAAARLETADGLIVATPVYKAAFSALLKTWLDLLPQLGLAGKVVLPLAAGGSDAHALALDYALRPVLTSMEARHVVNEFLVLDRFVDAPSSGDLSAIHADAEPALGKIVDDFLEGLGIVKGVAA
jgi:FMN reductase